MAEDSDGLITCPACGETAAVPEDPAGSGIICPRCRHTIVAASRATSSGETATPNTEDAAARVLSDGEPAEPPAWRPVPVGGEWDVAVPIEVPAPAPRPGDHRRDAGGRLPRRGSRPEDILTPKQYVNYQHGRILSGLFVFFGCMWVVGGAVLAVNSDPAADPPVAVWVVFAAAGVAGVVGGAAAFQGNRSWAWLAYLFALPLLFGCPVGTIISVLWMLGLSRHLAACDRIREAQSE